MGELRGEPGYPGDPDPGEPGQGTPTVSGVLYALRYLGAQEPEVAAEALGVFGGAGLTPAQTAEVLAAFAPAEPGPKPAQPDNRSAEWDPQRCQDRQ